jgi:hypothetical protein
MTEESRKSESPEEVNGELPIVKQTQNMEVDHQTNLHHNPYCDFILQTAFKE